MRYGDRLLMIAGRKDVSIRKVAMRAGVDEETLYAHCMGRQHPTLRTAMRTAKALGVTMDELLEGVDVV